jgi:hypothetical protein
MLFNERPTVNLHTLSDKIKGRDKFPREAGLALQASQLAQWKSKLQPWAFQALAEEAQLQNLTLPDDATGYDVWRNDSLTLFVVELVKP